MEYSKFLENYRKFTEGTETPEIMHLWCGLSALAGGAEKRVWIDRSFFKIFLNLYIILVGPPGVVSKSTSMGLAGKLLKENNRIVLEDSVLKEKIIQEMDENINSFKLNSTKIFNHASVTYLADELNVLLSSGMDMTKFLVTIYSKDEAYHYKTKNAGTYIIPNPFFNLIACATPEWFGRSVAADMTSTGFLARNIIVYEDESRGREPNPKITQEKNEARNVCSRIIANLQDLYGDLPLTADAEDWYDKWYRDQAIKPNEDYRMAGYYDRKSKTHIMKVGALMALGDERKEIDVIDLERALNILERTEVKMRNAYLIAGSNKLAPFVSRVINILEQGEGKVNMKDLLRSLYTDMCIEEIRSLLDQMEEMGFARRVQDSKGQKFLEKIDPYSKQ